jgi:hypothetical protein
VLLRGLVEFAVGLEFGLGEVVLTAGSLGWLGRGSEQLLVREDVVEQIWFLDLLGPLFLPFLAASVELLNGCDDFVPEGLLVDGEEMVIGVEGELSKHASDF